MSQIEQRKLSRYSDWLRAGRLKDYGSILRMGKKFLTPNLKTGSASHITSYVTLTGDFSLGLKANWA
jgi:hypothetical protein